MTAAIDEMLEAARRRISMVDPQRAAALRDADAVLIDTRPVAQRTAHGTIPGALVIERNVLEWRLDPASPNRDARVPSDRPVVVFCQEGYASSLAVAALVDIGLADVHDLAGGFAAWHAAGLPTAGGAVEVDPLTATIGAELLGVRVAEASDDAVAAIRAALLHWRVVFAREQHLTPTQLVAFGRRLGELTPAHPLVGGLDDDHPEVLVLDSGDYVLGVGTRAGGTSYNNRWHTDVTFSSSPPLGAVLSAVQVPERGGDTLWADLADAYRTLSAPLRTLVDPMVAVHDAGATFDRFRDDDPTGEHAARLRQLEPVRHPVVRIHPETGERVLFVNPTFTRRIEALAAAESATLLELLYAHSIEPERTVRWRWRAGDVAIWDNRATAHYAVADYGTARRVMHRVTIAQS